MAKSINQDACIQCGSCTTECPTDSIAEIDGEFRINADTCNECNGDDPTACQSVCPSEAIS